MSSEDVIEVGSSEDEGESSFSKKEPSPSIAKPRQRQRPHNAMVHIPGNLQTITNKHKTISTMVNKGLTLRKLEHPIPITRNIKMKNNSKAVPKNIHHSNRIIPVQISTQPKNNINPVSLMKKLDRTQIAINKVPSNTKVFRVHGNIKHPKTAIRVRQCGNQLQIINPAQNLPPSITVKKASRKRPLPASTVCNPLAINKKMKPNSTATSEEVPTVELDDDDDNSKTSGPLWYIRPEEQSEATEMMNKNNAEPQASKFLEITIEDSPVKPAQTYHVVEEIPITVEDSPAKVPKQKAKQVNSTVSDDDKDESVKSPSSKKKLEYPKEVLEARTIEIEIEPIETDDSPDPHVENESNSEKQDMEDKDIANENIIEVAESPVKHIQCEKTTTPTKGNPEGESNSNTVKNSDQDSEFHPVYQSFINNCLMLDNSDDMKKIVEKKIKSYYRQVPKEYTDSEQFIEMVTSKILSMKAGPEKLYLYIKDIVDELNLQRKAAKAQASTTTKMKEDSESFLYGEDSEFDARRQRQIRKLEKTLKKLHRAIQKLEEQEVDFDDEEDSVYLLTESDEDSSSHSYHKEAGRYKGNHSLILKRYKERMVRVHAKFCQLTNTKMPSEPRIVIEARPGQPSGPAKRLEKWINKKVPGGTPLPFPDFHDVLRCVRDANDDDKLGWNDVDIMETARDLFTRCGRKLQRRRQENEWRIAVSRLSVDIDPAQENNELKLKLEENKKLAKTKESDVFNKYADRQRQLNLEAQEIGDKEAEESPVESEEDEDNDEHSTLKDKEQRKERLRRLIKEKSKKAAESKSFEPKDDDPNCENPTNADNNEPVTDVSNEPEKEIESTEKDSVPETADDNGPPVQIQNPEDDKHKDIENIHTISDGSDRINSDIDELNLLHKLHSENEVNSSTVDSDDSDTPIDISDNLTSVSENEKRVASDVISIENSSYSESEFHSNQDNNQNNELSTKEVPSSNIPREMKKENSQSPSKITAQTNNEEYGESMGLILLASSDDEDTVEKVTNGIQDDSIPIRATIIISNNEVTATAEKITNVVNEINEETIDSISSTEKEVEFDTTNNNQKLADEETEMDVTNDSISNAEKEVALDTTNKKKRKLADEDTEMDVSESVKEDGVSTAEPNNKHPKSSDEGPKAMKNVEMEMDVDSEKVEVENNVSIDGQFLETTEKTEDKTIKSHLIEMKDTRAQETCDQAHLDKENVSSDNANENEIDTFDKALQDLESNLSSTESLTNGLL